ncbi:DUF1990 domain-containing protein [Flavilitoribacter nigricans]|uniref:DUF1990 domain-containing protein n=1 Tax=Flavilitoribacter nigricans (strain ATCC 23147 / DSM 23189 / NBRC 102662 / NCIMB 1420 / SS-2) TaxID=1122177 RepID=A0A2D0N3P8_FLAN2|nr:DUF1990 domain-containing protein [Flavilitoribacter nigricans]PHN03067.1 DUF1990 domain-containing protein [Flavilitoribacter nigricans DSM 23189 = NBRC 102662]
MKVGFTTPTPLQLDQFLISRKTLSPVYPGQFGTRLDFREKLNTPLTGKYDYDERKVCLGSGPSVFATAKAAIRNWKMFPPNWTKVYPDNAPITTGQQVLVLFKLLGVWWWNSSEIRYTIDEDSRFGFAYGTLPGHVESGEELFLVEMDEHGKVWYKIKAFSRPAYLIVRLVYPFARSQQRRFVRESMALMKNLTHNTADHG